MSGGRVNLDRLEGMARAGENIVQSDTIVVQVHSRKKREKRSFWERNFKKKRKNGTFYENFLNLFVDFRPKYLIARHPHPGEDMANLLLIQERSRPQD